MNGGAVIAGSLVGILFKKVLNENLQDALMKGLALVVMYMGISGSLVGTNILVETLSMVIGCLIGTAIDIDGKFTRVSNKLSERFKMSGGGHSFSEGFVNGTMVVCIGAAAIMGPLEAGLTGSIDLLIAKSLIDFMLALVLAAAMGIGVAAASICVIIYQGAIFLLATVASPYLSEYVINEISCLGYILIMAISLNLLGLTNLKLMNYIPAVFLPIILCLFIK